MEPIVTEIITEGRAKLRIPKADVNRSMPVFYNPVMKRNRDLSILFLNSITMNELAIADVLAGSGVRGIRYALELEPGKFRSIDLNDHNLVAVQNIEDNARLNNVNLRVHGKDADSFLASLGGFDYIDIDPFGTPNPFLDQAIKHLSRTGILAVTATDTAPLSGTYPEACQRKYWAIPKRDHLMHEVGIRILIRKIQLVAAQYERALVPLYSISDVHYFRVFLQSTKGKKAVDATVAQHGMYQGAGPMWLGQLWDTQLAMKMFLKNTDKSNNSLLQVIAEEALIPTVGFHDIHMLVKKYGIQSIPKKSHLISRVAQSGFPASETHFSGTGIRTTCSETDLVAFLR
jgi:tRNA (guanine26-N2/guanine27-N2)-dimethyltransferase